MRSKEDFMNYTWIATDFEKSKFLSGLQSLLDPDNLLVLTTGSDIQRRQLDGVWTIKGQIHGKTFGVLYHDFKVNGGSYGVDVSKRIVDFFNQMIREKTPVIFALSTLGVRMMEGRKVFMEAFNILPVIKKFSDQHLLITVTIGRCLGLGAIFYQVGHYRLATENETLLNLTGPEVFKLFFGQGIDFDQTCSARRQFEKTDIIHEIYPNKEECFGQIRNIVALTNNKQESFIPPFYKEPKTGLTRLQSQNKEKLQELLYQLVGSSSTYEILPEVKSSVRTYIISHPLGAFGLMINPPGMANLIDVKTIKKYRNVLKFFERLELPIISLVDTSGGDPRAEQNDMNIIKELYDLTVDLIIYPFAKKGIINGRCFGGASVLTIPPIFGGMSATAVKGAQMGIMHHSIIRKLLTGSERLLNLWEENHALEKDDLSDIVEQGGIDELVEPSDLYAVVTRFLLESNPKQRDQKDLDGRIYQFRSTEGLNSYEIQSGANL